MLFDFYGNKTERLSKLDNFILDHVVTYRKNTSSIKLMRSEEELNSLDRRHMARIFYEQYLTPQLKKECICEKRFIRLTALKIDEKIPQAYVKLVYQLEGPLTRKTAEYYHHDLFYLYKSNQTRKLMKLEGE